MATWLDVANRQGVLGGSWTRLGSEARWTSQMPCRCVAIGSKGASEALLAFFREANQGTLRP